MRDRNPSFVKPDARQRSIERRLEQRPNNNLTIPVASIKL